MKYRTKTHKDGGFAPAWDGQEILIPIRSINEVITIRCLDEDLLSNDLVGEVTLKVRDLYPPTKGGLGGEPHQDWVSLEYKGQIAALILLECKLNTLYTEHKQLESARSQANQFHSNSGLGRNVGGVDKLIPVR